MANEVKVKLTISDRLRIGVLYPKEGDLITQILVKGIADKIEIKEKEAKQLELKVNNGVYTWKNTKAKVNTFTFTSAEIQLLKDQVEKLDKEKKVTQVLLDLCIKIKEV